MDTFVMSAMRAAEKAVGGFDSVPDDFATAMFALWSQGMNRTFEAIEIMGYPRYYDFQRFIVLVTANFTSMHNILF